MHDALVFEELEGASLCGVTAAQVKRAAALRRQAASGVDALEGPPPIPVVTSEARRALVTAAAFDRITAELVMQSHQ